MSHENAGERQGNLVALTWQQITIGLMVLPLIFAIAFAVYAAPGQHGLAYELVGGIVVVITALGFWHVRAVGRPDLHPDILAILFEPGEIRECNGIHVVGRARQVETGIRWEFAVQNLMDAPRRARITVSVLNDDNAISVEVPPIDVSVGGSAVKLAQVDVPVRGLSTVFTLVAEYRVNVAGIGGTRVRFARRDVVAEPNKALAGATIAAGLIAGAPGAILAGRTLAKDRCMPRIEVDVEPRWGVPIAGAQALGAAVSQAILWTPGDDADAHRLRALHARLVRRPGQFPAAA
jgi:hypothetical protein